MAWVYHTTEDYNAIDIAFGSWIRVSASRVSLEDIYGDMLAPVTAQVDGCMVD